MKSSTIFFIWLLIWWVTFFMILPVGVRRNEEEGKGFDAGAPARANLKKKILWNTVFSGVIMAIIVIVTDLKIVNWRALFQQ
ncbi:MAG: DUF1467 family protein [Alphaproteobacteria bacterium]|nr:DUF1467 family protein [Alphaproteobacteria bacterium]